MNASITATARGMHLVSGHLIAPVPGDLDDTVLIAFKQAVLAKAHAQSIRGVLLDVSAVQVMDSVCFSLLADCARMLALIGAQVVFVGFQAGVVAALMDLEVKTDDIVSARTLEEGFDRLQEMTRVEPLDEGPVAEIDATAPENTDEDGDAREVENDWCAPSADSDHYHRS